MANIFFLSLPKIFNEKSSHSFHLPWQYLQESDGGVYSERHG